MKPLIVCLICVIFSIQTMAQPDSLWGGTYGGTGRDDCYSVQQTTDGGYILAGGTQIAGNSDFWLVKTDANGGYVWNRTFGGSGVEICRSVQQTTDGGYVLGGYATSFGAGDSDFWLLKTSVDGDSVWSRTFGGTGSDACYSVQQTTDGGYVLGGYTHPFGDDDFWLVKVNSSGSSPWSHTFGGTARDLCFSVQQTADGGYVLAGGTYSFGAGASDFWLVRTDANGNILWSHAFGGSGQDLCYSVWQTTDGGYILGGYTESYGAGDWDFWLLRTNANGDSLWSRTFGGSSEERCYSIQQTTDGGYILGGYTESYGAGGSDFWLVRTNANGDSLWSRTFGGTDNDRCGSVQQTTDGGYILGGYTASYGAGDWDFWLVKTGPDPLAVEPEIRAVPAKYTLHANFPNPFNPITTIRYDVEHPGFVRLTIFNLLGQRVTRLSDSRHLEGSYEVSWDAAGLPSGIYLCRMEADGFSQTRKVVLVK
jgi:uncharacterized delta-60 repeat protein